MINLEEELEHWKNKYTSTSNINNDDILHGTFIPEGQNSNKIDVQLDVKAYKELIDIIEFIAKYKIYDLSIKRTFPNLRCNYSNAKLDGVRFYETDFDYFKYTSQKLIFSGASFIGSNIINCNFTNCFCSGADFSYCNFSNSNLNHSSFSSTTLNNTKFDKTDVTNLLYIETDAERMAKANFYGSNFQNITADPETMAELQYNYENPANDINAVINKKIELWKQDGLKLIEENNILIKTKFEGCTGINKELTTFDLKLNKDLYKQTLTLSYNLTRADNIIDNIKSDIKKDKLIQEFNEYVEKIPPIKGRTNEDRIKELLIQGADLRACNFNPNYKTTNYKLTGATCDFNDFCFDYSNFDNTCFNNCEMLRTTFNRSTIKNSTFNNCKIKEGKFTNCATISNVNFENCYLEKTEFTDATISDTSFKNSTLNTATFRFAHITDCNFTHSNCGNVLFTTENLENCNLTNMYYEPNINTDFNSLKFLHSNINVANISDELRSVVTYNRRKNKWEEYMKRNSLNILFKPATNLFWKMTDYGYSTTSIIKYFFWISFIFAQIYTLSHGIGYEFIKINIPFPEEDITFTLSSFTYTTTIYFKVFCKSMYFSVVTMTTLGFGDITAKEGNYLGYFLVSIQVILGYVILGALVTRFGTLFNSIGPTITPDQYKDKLTPKKVNLSPPK